MVEAFTPCEICNRQAARKLTAETILGRKRTMGIAARLTKRTAIIGTVSAVAIAGGVAFAAWTISGSGSASAQAGSASAVSFNAATPTQNLYPGASGVPVHASGVNTNPFPVDFTVSNASTVNAGACTPTSAVVFTPAATAVHLPANATGADVVVGTISMDNTADNNCQGVSFTITIAGSGVSASS
ncbi:hypothetical protein AB0K00_02000 [Dactylosporangium sp. NPDC049525]|uniref:hypothetical protein n=1 Tax=Dactylosporangium sp. NPDC049525 TaxID=3154730 RepID=UPI0034435DD6